MTGPQMGAVFALDGEEFVIGRDESSHFAVKDIAASRRHCVIKREGECFNVTDLGSHNGTFVNDVPIVSKVLSNADRIRIGTSIFLFLTDEKGEGLGEVRLSDHNLRTLSAIRLRPEDATAAATARDLSLLIKISTVINSIRTVEELQRRLLELIFEVVPAERGVILLTTEGSEELSLAFGLNRQGENHQPMQVSRTIVEQVFSEGVAMLSNEVLEDDSFGGVQSLIASHTRALICVPLILLGKAQGVIYLDTKNPAVGFEERHLSLMGAVAGIATVALDNARHRDWLENEVERLHREINIEHNMVGDDRCMREVYEFIAKAAPTSSTVLIRGESGTGKELVARAIHLNSPRARRPFVAINCAALTESLLESELFGHERGAFTGAVAQKKGKLEAADRGTVFLDEVGELAHSLQAKLLRALQEHEIERVGGTRPIKLDIRLIAATNKNLEDAIKEGSFRRDLYYRLNVVSCMVPRLKDRPSDIPMLATYFAERYSEKCNRRIARISPEAMAYLTSYDWPGNVRELENAIERAIVLGSTDTILPDDLPEAVLEAGQHAGAPLMLFYESVREAKKQIILKALTHANSNYTEAAKLLGVHPNNLHRLVRNLDLKHPAE